ncbi:MAG: YpdA family putative bacillithiol disulfide reductase [Bacteroidetes bacterium]|nr:YpdA family putative bacillithiol disulfide reductase [Bacteroidota bacterium]MCY4204185.1 YpdA family putative bacillithiol disulfide reductase [Bacteroidota bacterium]
MTDIVIIGAGPVGLACGIEAARSNLRATVIDKGTIVNSLVGYPTHMEFFSTAELLEIGGHPFPTLSTKPTRPEALKYYRQVAVAESLNLQLYERVQHVEGSDNNFTVVTTKGTHLCRKVIVATGFFDIPNPLDVPGEELPKVTHYYHEPYAYAGQRVAIIGAKNSAAKAALECHHYGAKVTLIHRGDSLSEKIKYWIRPDIQNRIKEGSIVAHFNTQIQSIKPNELILNGPEGMFSLSNDFVIAMTGYRPDYAFLETLGITISDDPFRTPGHHPETFETNRPGLYMAGTVCGGLRTSRWFIENGRFHATQIIHHISTGRVEQLKLEQRNWKTAE